MFFFYSDRFLASNDFIIKNVYYRNNNSVGDDINIFLIIQCNKNNLGPKF